MSGEKDNIWNWDIVHSCFRPSRFCPFCSHILNDVQVSQSRIALCPKCLNTFEWLSLQHENGLRVNWPHRPGNAFCTLTGERLWHRSPFDWTEYGGSPARTHSVIDREEQLFGAPSRFRQWTLKHRWNLRYVHPSLDKANHQICALNILRGELYVSFRNGYIARYSNVIHSDEAQVKAGIKLYHSQEHLIDIEPETYNHPAFVGEFALTVGAQDGRGCALLRFLDQPPQTSPIEVRVNAPGPQVKFWGPALTFGETEFGFVLVEARMLQERFEPCGVQVILPNASLEKGYETPDWANHPLLLEHLPRLRQPPIYLSDSNPEFCVVLFLLNGMDMLRVNPHSGDVVHVQGMNLFSGSCIPAPCFTAYSHGNQTHTLYTCLEVDGHLRYAFSEPWHPSDRSIQWQLVNMAIEEASGKDIGCLGVNMGARLAVEQAWAHLRGSKLSYQGVRMVSDSSRHMVLCGAGVLFIENGKLTLRNDNHGWRPYDLIAHNNKVLLNPQGPNALGSIAMCGRIVFVSTGVGLHCVELVGEGGES